MDPNSQRAPASEMSNARFVTGNSRRSFSSTRFAVRGPGERAAPRPRRAIMRSAAAAIFLKRQRSVLRHILEVMQAYSRPWWIAGGWAIDLYLGHQSRPHQDIDIAVLRRDQRALRTHLQGWHFTKVVNGASFAWTEQEELELPVHELHAENGTDHLEFLLNEAAGDQWLFRRNRAVSASIQHMTRQAASGIPYFTPEVVLLYKAKSMRARDRADFNSVLPKLEPPARSWLASALQSCHPLHEWLGELGASATSALDR